jgi:Flp pilus assembly protein TadD
MSRGKPGEGITTMLKNMPIQRGRPTKNAVSDQLLRVNLGQEAVKMALCADWERAVELNRDILELCPDNCEAANRLAKALMELARYQEAREVLEDLCPGPPPTLLPAKTWSG